MDRPADSLPQDFEGLRAFALAVLAERDQLMTMNERLRQLLRKAQGFAASSERLARLSPDQLALALEDIETSLAKSEAVEEKQPSPHPRPKRQVNRGALPAHLPRIHETI